MKLLFVCTGNICRSPMAAAIARDLLAPPAARDVEVSSAGTYALVGHARDRGRDGDRRGARPESRGHRARQLTRELVAEADLVVGMKREHADEALPARRAAGDHARARIRDPYGRGARRLRATPGRC